MLAWGNALGVTHMSGRGNGHPGMSLKTLENAEGSRSDPRAPHRPKDSAQSSPTQGLAEMWVTPRATPQAGAIPAGNTRRARDDARLGRCPRLLHLAPSGLLGQTLTSILRNRVQRSEVHERKSLLLARFGSIQVYGLPYVLLPGPGQCLPASGLRHATWRRRMY